MYIEVNSNGNRYDFTYRDYDLTFAHSLTLPPNVTPSADALGMIAVISRPKNVNSYTLLGVEISAATKLFLEISLKAEIRTRSTADAARNSNLIVAPEDSVLCFSGGFDSIAAKYLMEPNIRLMSIDFGGEFTRESLFFKKFPTDVICWDIRSARTSEGNRYNENLDWRFMLAPALCYRRNNLDTLGICAGTIMETQYWFRGQPRDQFRTYPTSMFGPATALLYPVTCLSEYCTALIASECLSPEDFLASLESLAPATSFKRYRKEVLAAIAKRTSLPQRPTSIKKQEFGRSRTEDIIGMYISWKVGNEWAASNYMSGIPTDALTFDMGFFEKFNPQNLRVMDRHNADQVANKLMSIGIPEASDVDLNEIESIRTYLGRFYKN